MEFIFVFTIVFSLILFINLLKVVKIVRAFWVGAFVYNKVLTVLFRNKYVGTMRATEFV